MNDFQISLISFWSILKNKTKTQYNGEDWMTSSLQEAFHKSCKNISQQLNKFNKYFVCMKETVI